MDKAINNLLNPLGHLKNEILVSINCCSSAVIFCMQFYFACFIFKSYKNRNVIHCPCFDCEFKFVKMYKAYALLLLLYFLSV